MGRTRIGNDRVLEQLPHSLQWQMAFERFYLHDIKSYQDKTLDPAFDSGYLPQNCSAFALPCYWVPKRALYVYGEQSDRETELALFDGCGADAQVLFPIHPTSLAVYEKFLSRVGARDAGAAGLRIWAVPTSSTRTLLAWPDQLANKAVFLKTSLYSPIFADRRLHLRTVGRSVGSSRLFEEVTSSLRARLGQFPESVGFVPRSMQSGGVIVRSIPAEIKSDTLLVAPLFALFSRGHGADPLLLTILKRSGMDAWEFVENVLCAPFARLWIDLALNHGLMIEAHAQDLMLALSPDFSCPKQFFYRDFEGVQVDWALRRRRGLSVPDGLPLEWRWYETYETLGHRQTQLAWYKQYLSLFAYVDLVLHEIDLALCEWQAAGVICGARRQEARATEVFSRHLRTAIRDLFGVTTNDAYDIHDSPKTFAIFLMKLRTEVMRSAA